MSSALTHNRVRNNFRSGTETIITSTGTKIIERSMRPMPKLMSTSTNGFGETSRGALPLNRTTRNYSIINKKSNALNKWVKKTTLRKNALTSGTVGSSAAAKRAWARRSKYTAKPMSLPQQNKLIYNGPSCLRNDHTRASFPGGTIRR